MFDGKRLKAAPRLKFTNAPQVPRLAAFLDSPDMIGNPVAVFEKYRRRYGPTFAFHFGGAKRAIVSSDPEFIQQVLQKHADNYRKSDIQIERMGEFQGQGLLNSHGDYWLRQRRLLSQGFRRSFLSELLPAQLQTLDAALVQFDQAARRGPVEIHGQMIRLTLRLVGSSLFGAGFQEHELEQVAQTIATIQQFIVRQIVQPYMIPWFRLSGQSHYYQQLRIDADQIIREYIEARRKQGGPARDLLQIMLDTPYEDTGRPMSPEQILIEILQLMVAGNETSSAALSWTFYLLARHPAQLERVREEVRDTLGAGPITLAALHELELTRRVLDEAMRLYPSFWMIDRTAVGDDEIEGVHIPAGVTVVPYIYGVHRNPAIWDDPERFDPSRFERARVEARHPFAHIPFGGGPRICIGSNMALAQMLLIVATIVGRYRFEPARPEPVEIRPMMILRPGGPINLRFSPIE